MKDQFKVELRALSGVSREVERSLNIELQGKVSRKGIRLFVESDKPRDLKRKLEKVLYHLI